MKKSSDTIWKRRNCRRYSTEHLNLTTHTGGFRCPFAEMVPPKLSQRATCHYVHRSTVNADGEPQGSVFGPLLYKLLILDTLKND